MPIGSDFNVSLTSSGVRMIESSLFSLYVAGLLGFHLTEFPQYRSAHSYSMVVWHQSYQVQIKRFKVFHQLFCLVFGFAKFSVNMFYSSFLFTNFP